jgi:hypothetical protein
MAHNLNAYIKTHKEGAPIRPVINNVHAPSYKTAKLLNVKLTNLINLPNNFITKDPQEVDQDLRNIQLNDNHKMTTMDIKYLFVYLPIKNILHTTSFWLNRNSIDPTTIEQTLHLLKTILEQNYFQHNGHFYKPKKGITMRSPISSTLAEIYLQHLEEKYIKHSLEHKDIIYYRRYVDDLLIIYDQDRFTYLLHGT